MLMFVWPYYFISDDTVVTQFIYVKKGKIFWTFLVVFALVYPVIYICIYIYIYIHISLFLQKVTI